jgi:hypothetical protein
MNLILFLWFLLAIILLKSLQNVVIHIKQTQLGLHRQCLKKRKPQSVQTQTEIVALIQSSLQFNFGVQGLRSLLENFLIFESLVSKEILEHYRLQHSKKSRQKISVYYLFKKKYQYLFCSLWCTCYLPIH